MSDPETTHGSTHADSRAAAATGDEFILPARSGEGPNVTEGMPHIQLDQTASDEMLQRMADWAFSLNGVVEQPSRTSLPGARALTVAPNTPGAQPEAMMLGREFAHIHPQPHGGSMHMMLPPGKLTEVVEKGWGERHPLAIDGSVPNLLMVYAPRNDEDLAVIQIIVGAAVDYATMGRG